MAGRGISPREQQQPSCVSLPAISPTLGRLTFVYCLQGDLVCRHPIVIISFTPDMVVVKLVEPVQVVLTLNIGLVFRCSGGERY